MKRMVDYSVIVASVHWLIHTQTKYDPAFHMIANSWMIYVFCRYSILQDRYTRFFSLLIPLSCAISFIPLCALFLDARLQIPGINFFIVFPQALLYTVVYAFQHSKYLSWQSLLFALTLGILFSAPTEPSHDIVGTSLEYVSHRVLSITFLASSR